MVASCMIEDEGILLRYNVPFLYYDRALWDVESVKGMHAHNLPQNQ